MSTMQWKGQDWLGQGVGHIRHGRPCNHLQTGWHRTEAFSLRFDRIPVNTGGSHGPRALRRILLAAPHGSEQRPCIPSYISTAAAAHDIRRHRTSCLQVRHSPQPSERAPRTMSDSEARWTCHVPVVIACISPFMRSSRTVESLSCFR